MKNKIGIFDSGIGGTTTLKEIVKKLPNENYIYYCDSHNNPYGNKTSKELYNIISKIVDFLILKKVKMIVIACNTATTKCIKKLRENYHDMIFIGTEPAIKVASDKNYKNTLVLATKGTISSKRTKELLNLYKHNNQKITLIKCHDLANAIENNKNTEIDKILLKYLYKYTNDNIDSIVLGCTHYPLIKNKIQKLFPKSKIIDGNKGVAKRVKNQLINNNILNNDNKKGSIEFIIKKCR